MLYKALLPLMWSSWLSHACVDMVLQAGGVLDRRKVGDLSELSEYDVVVNCLGLGALKLFNDDKMFPVRYAMLLTCVLI